MWVLGFDTSNYATSLAVFDTCAGEVVYDKKKFLPVKPGQLGLRQSDAVFHHTEALPGLLEQLGQQADLTRVEAAARAFAAAKGLPVVQTTHQQGHMAAALYAAHRPELFHLPCLVFHVSGGTTDLILCEGVEKLTTIGTSSDLYAGQAVDRVGVALGFSFPAGEMVSRTAAECDESIRPKASVKGMTCSLSGLENQCNRLLQDGRSPAYVCKYCLLCVGETVVRMAKAALEEYPGLPVICAGGVMSSGLIAEYVSHRLPDVTFVPGKFSSDNAIGVSILAAGGF